MDIAGFEDTHDTIDLSKAEWVRDIPFPAMDGVGLMVRSPNHKPFIKARDAALRAASLAGGEVEYNLIVAKAMAEHLLADWSGVNIGGKAAPFDAALAVRLLTADDPHGIGDRLRKALDWSCSKVAVDLLTNREEIAGNSPKP